MTEREMTMLPEHYEEVKELIERIADYYGPVEEDPLLEEQTAEMRRLTGRDQGHDLPTFRRAHPEEPWYVEEIMLFGYEEKMLSVTCTNVPEADRMAILQMMEGFGCLPYEPR